MSDTPPPAPQAKEAVNLGERIYEKINELKELRFIMLKKAQEFREVIFDDDFLADFQKDKNYASIVADLEDIREYLCEKIEEKTEIIIEKLRALMVERPTEDEDFEEIDELLNELRSYLRSRKPEAKLFLVALREYVGSFLTSTKETIRLLKDREEMRKKLGSLFEVPEE